MDELPEFKRSILEVIRLPPEDRVITISRAKSTVDYPASLTVVNLDAKYSSLIYNKIKTIQIHIIIN